jgi:hypothetical protein
VGKAGGWREEERGKPSQESPKIALIPYYHRFSQTDLFGFIFPTIVDNRFINRFAQTDLFGFIFPTIVDNRFINKTIDKTIDKTIVNDSRENETKKIG